MEWEVTDDDGGDECCKENDGKHGGMSLLCFQCHEMEQQIGCSMRQHTEHSDNDSTKQRVEKELLNKGPGQFCPAPRHGESVFDIHPVPDKER